MKVLLKDSLSLFGCNLSYGAITEGKLSSEIETLCGMVKYISGEECDQNNIIFKVEALERKNPAWYSSINSMVASIKKSGNTSNFTELLDVVNGAFATVEVDLRQCSLKARVYKKANPKEHRTPFHANIPDSIFNEITGVVKSQIEVIKKNEKAGIRTEGKRLLCIFVPSSIYDYTLKKVDEIIKINISQPKEDIK